MRYWLTLDADGVIRGKCPSEIEQPGAIEVDADLFGRANAGSGRMRFAGGALSDAPPPAVPLPDISDVQFGQGLWDDGVITYAECMAFIQVGQLPATLEQLLAHLPDDDTGEPTPRKVARADLAGRRMFQFAHPLVETVRELMEHADPVWTVDHLRARWAVWATL